MIKFASLSEALQRGYVPARRGRNLFRHRNGEATISHAYWPYAVGAKFKIKTFVRVDTGLGTFTNLCLGKSYALSTTVLIAGRKREMFTPQAWARAQQLARRAIESWKTVPIEEFDPSSVLPEFRNGGRRGN